jgi:hypothetical protein
MTCKKRKMKMMEKDDNKEVEKQRETTITSYYLHGRDFFLFL